MFYLRIDGSQQVEYTFKNIKRNIYNNQFTKIFKYVNTKFRRDKKGYTDTSSRNTAETTT